MNVQEIMTNDVETCRLDDTLNSPAAIMWGHDCGVVPVVDDDGRVVGMITDRDICMAAYTQGVPLSAIRVENACSRTLRACRLDDDLLHRRLADVMLARPPAVHAVGEEAKRAIGDCFDDELFSNRRYFDGHGDGSCFFGLFSSSSRTAAWNEARARSQNLSR